MIGLHVEDTIHISFKGFKKVNDDAFLLTNSNIFLGSIDQKRLKVSFSTLILLLGWIMLYRGGGT